MTETYLAQSAVTDPRAYASWVSELPGDVASLREASSHLVFHYWAGGDFAAHGVPAERATEIDTRYVDDILALCTSGRPSH